MMLRHTSAAAQLQPEPPSPPRVCVETTHLAKAGIADFRLVYDAEAVLAYLRAQLEGRPCWRPLPITLRSPA